MASAETVEAKLAARDRQKSNRPFPGDNRTLNSTPAATLLSLYSIFLKACLKHMRQWVAISMKSAWFLGRPVDPPLIPTAWTYLDFRVETKSEILAIIDTDKPQKGSVLRNWPAKSRAARLPSRPNAAGERRKNEPRTGRATQPDFIEPGIYDGLGGQLARRLYGSRYSSGRTIA